MRRAKLRDSYEYNREEFRARGRRDERPAGRARGGSREFSTTSNRPVASQAKK